MSYNGWKNRETWLVNVWFEMGCLRDVEEAKEIIEREYENCSPFLRDFVDLSLIDWEELKGCCED